MASETVPAAANGPHDPATTPAQPTGLAGALARIEPARGATATFSLDPDDTAAATSSTSSSAAYHDTDPTPTGGTQNSSGSKTQQPREGVFKTMLRAAAERWRKGADIHLKRLDMQKARHQAAQVKETRQVVVNNSPAGTPGRSTNPSGMGSGKGTGKTNSGGSGKAPKNTHKTPGSGGSSGRSSNSGAGSGGRGTNRPSQGRDHNGSSTSGSRGAKDSSDRSGRKQPKSSGDGSKAGGSGAGAGGKEGKTGKDGKPGKDAPTTPATGPKNDSGKVRLSKDDKTPKNSGADPKNTTADRKTADAKGSTQSKGPSSPADNAARKPGAQADLDKKTVKPTGSDTPKPADDKPTPAGKDTKTTPGTPGKANVQAPPRTQSSREAGYRDGNRAARLVGHVEAYRDGARDGWNDGRKATAHDKHRLDTARTERLAQRKEPTVPTTPLAGAQPIPVDHINDTHVTLPGGSVHTRGEIRTVKQYERNLTDKLADLRKIEEAAQSLKAHAEEQASKASTLAEQARAVEGGDKLIATLLHLQEQAALQAQLADDLYTRAVRSADATTTLICDMEIRYGGIYKAVCDSETTQPAKLFWYQDQGATLHV